MTADRQEIRELEDTHNIRILLYLRISRADEGTRAGKKDESDSILNQRDLLHHYIESRPEFRDSAVSELCDDGYSGTSFERPAVKELLKRAGERTVDCIIVKDFSRFGRDYLTVCDCIDQLFPFLGIRFISVNDGYDSLTYDGITSSVETGFQNVVYAYYSRDISVKERSSKRAKALQGDFLGPFAPIGYQKDPDNRNHLVPDEKAAKIVREIFKLAGGGLSVAAITKRLNADKIPTPSELKREQGMTNKRWEGVCRERLWDISSVTRILRDERYLGKNIYGKRYCPEAGNKKTRKKERGQWIVVPDCHKPLITEQEFQEAGDMLRTFAELAPRRADSALFKGKLRCGVCGCALSRLRKKESAYRCASRDRADGLECMEKAVEEERLKETVGQIVKLYSRIFLDKPGKPELEQRTGKKGRLAALKKRMGEQRAAWERLAEQKAVLYEKYADGFYDREQYIKKRETVTEGQEALKKELADEELALAQLSRRENEEAASCRETNPYLSEGLTRDAVRAFIDCIYVYHERAVRIEWLLRDPFL